MIGLRLPAHLASRALAMLALSLAPCLLSGAAPQPDGVALIRTGESWKFLVGRTAPSTPQNAWHQLDFDDRFWPVGRCAFSTSGAYYGVATVLTHAAPDFRSVFLRKYFEVDALPHIGWLMLRMDYDDGFVAYLNGVEVLRKNILADPEAPVPFNAHAELHQSGHPELFDLSHMRHLLKPGRNLLALQVHTSSLDTDLVVSAELLANFVRGPFVQYAATDRVQVICHTAVPAACELRFGETIPDRIKTSPEGLIHVFTLDDLKSDTTYRYEVFAQADEAHGRSPLFEFRTLKESGAVDFLVLGDSGVGKDAQYIVADQMRVRGGDLVLHCGDVIYYSFTHQMADLKCMSVYGPHMRSVPFYFTMGNHDLYSGEAAYLDTFHLPTNPVSGTEHFYSFDHGDAHFTCVYLPTRIQLPEVIPHQLEPDSAQMQWLEQDLAGTAKPWKILFLHSPLNSSGYHRPDDYDRNRVYDRFEIQELLLPVAERHGVQLVLAGHDHNFERFTPTNGVHSVVTGGGGVSLYPLLERDFGSADFWLRHHFLQVTLQDPTLTVRATGTDGTAFDQFTITRTNSLNAAYSSLEHTPVVEAPSWQTLNGNIQGQQFDLKPNPIPAVTGRLSNLGLLHVNHDRHHLYLGLESAMIYGHSVICLLLGPAQDSDFAPAPADKEGPAQNPLAHALAHSSRTDVPPALTALPELIDLQSFLPTTALLLGDELADVTDRTFTRSGMNRAMGQGVFLIEPGFPSPPHARLQQFHRSPQFRSFPEESNAGFMEVAVPWAALGGVPSSSGKQIQIAAVVLLSETGPENDLHLDTGGIGSQLRQSDTPTTILPLTVSVGPLLDQDGDGLTHEQENDAGTDPANPDTDNDGLWDGWELAHDLNPLLPDPADGVAADPDRDGMNWHAEMIAGTDPFDPASNITLSAAAEEGRVRLRWLGQPGRTYQVRQASGPEGPFHPLDHQPIQTFQAGAIEMLLDAAQNTAFYRTEVRVDNPPGQ